MILTVDTYLNIRTGTPSTEAPNENYLVPGNTVDVVDIVTGNLYEGNNIWYKCIDGHFYWSGGFYKMNINSPNKIGPIDDSKLGWGLKLLDIKHLWDLAGNMGDGIKIAVIDTGIANGHPDINYAKIKTHNVLSGASNADDYDGHGTHCTGIICATGKQAFGTAPNAEILAIKVGLTKKPWNINNIIAAIRHAISQNVDIINISGEFSFKESNLYLLKTAIEDAYIKEILIIASAGNDGNDSDGADDDFSIDNYPAAYHECISVGSIGRNKIRAKDCTLSNNLDIMAPGVDILSTGKNKEYFLDSGTSMATPFVTGVSAVLLSYMKSKYNKKVKPGDIKKILNETTGNTKNDMYYGYGIINPLKALLKINEL